MGQLSLPMIITAAGYGTQAFAQYQGGHMAKDAYDMQADATRTQAAVDQEIFNQNAKIKDREAKLELARARKEAAVFRAQGIELQATQNVSYAKGGVLATVGSPATVMEQTAESLKADRMEILRAGFIARSFRLSEAANLRYQGRAAIVRGEDIALGYEASGQGAVIAGRGKMFGTILTGVGTLYTMANSTGGSSSGLGGMGSSSPVAQIDYSNVRGQGGGANAK